MNKMIIRLLSDLHLEFVNETKSLVKNLIEISKSHRKNNSVLILAGDIGNPRYKNYYNFINEISKNYDKTFIISGNHEYYNLKNMKPSTIDEIDELISSIVRKIPNVHFLNRDSYIYNNVRFLGCTLWSKPDKSLSQYMNDFNRIHNMTPELYETMHNKDVQWLEQELFKKYNRTVIITHHLPTYKLVPIEYEDHFMNSFFATDLDHLVKESDIWCCGHSHSSKNITLGKCKCYLNPIGYYDEDSDYSPSIEIHI